MIDRFRIPNKPLSVSAVTPTIEKDPIAAPVKEGENFTLFCNASGSSLTLSWRRNGSVVDHSDDSRIHLLADNEHLIITNATRTDNGAYWCVVSNKVGNASSNAAIITVQCEYSYDLRVVAKCQFYRKYRSGPRDDKTDSCLYKTLWGGWVFLESLFSLSCDTTEFYQIGQEAYGFEAFEISHLHDSRIS